MLKVLDHIASEPKIQHTTKVTILDLITILAEPQTLQEITTPQDITTIVIIRQHAHPEEDILAEGTQAEAMEVVVAQVAEEDK